MDKTKQEILSQYETYVKREQPHNTQPIFLAESVYLAMEEYAEQEAKAYASWLSHTVIGGRTASKLWEDYKSEIGKDILT